VEIGNAIRAGTLQLETARQSRKADGSRMAAVGLSAEAITLAYQRVAARLVPADNLSDGSSDAPARSNRGARTPSGGKAWPCGIIFAGEPAGDRRCRYYRA